MLSLVGWYAYGWAAEPFIVSAVATYVPLLLEQMARENAVWAIDKRTPCHQAPSDPPGLVPIPLPTPPKCVVRMPWGWVDTSSLPLYTFSFSVVVQILLVVSVSGIADRTRHRTSMLVSFAVIGSLCTLVLASTSKSHYYFASLLSAMGNACFGAVAVIGNAYLPALASAERTRIVLKRRADVERYYGDATDDDSLEGVDQAHVSASISGKGVAVGYSAALIVQVLTMLWLALSGERALHRVIGFVGMWWLIFQIPVALWLRDLRDPLTLSVAEEEQPDSMSTVGGILEGWRILYKTARKASELKDITTFLIGWFLLSDAVTTINSTAVLFARANLQMAAPALALIGLLTVVFAIAGSLLASRALKHRVIDTSALTYVAIGGAAIPLYGVIGFFTPWLGLQHSWEMYLLAGWYGLVLGALNAVCRSLYSLLIPRGREAMFFALFAVTDKGSSVLGPAITALITDKTHNIRYTFYFLLVTMLVSAYVFTNVNIKRGQQDAERVLDINDSDEDFTPPTQPRPGPIPGPVSGHITL